MSSGIERLLQWRKATRKVNELCHDKEKNKGRNER